MTPGLDAPTRRRLAIPAALFLLYVLYLALASPKPFLERWIEGCFAFFIALVLAYVILRGSGRDGDEGDGEGDPPPPGGENGA